MVSQEAVVGPVLKNMPLTGLRSNEYYFLAIDLLE